MYYDYDEYMESYICTLDLDEDRVEKINDDLWELVKWYFDDYNQNHDDCTFTVNEQARTISATDYVELPYLFYYWSGGQNKRYKALKEFKKITLVSPLAKGIITNIECYRLN